jgi:hypothetical protein
MVNAATIAARSICAARWYDTDRMLNGLGGCVLSLRSAEWCDVCAGEGRGAGGRAPVSRHEPMAATLGGRHRYMLAQMGALLTQACVVRGRRPSESSVQVHFRVSVAAAETNM